MDVHRLCVLRVIFKCVCARVCMCVSGELSFECSATAVENNHFPEVCVYPVHVKHSQYYYYHAIF